MVIPWIGYSLSALLKQVGAHQRGEVRRVRHAPRCRAVPRPEEGRVRLGRAGLALYRGAPHGRGHAPAHALDAGHVRPGAAQPERRAGARGHPLEVRLQERQEHRSIRLTSEQPKTAWEKAAPSEYGFYSNVNPTVDHPRWSQATERRIGEFRRRKTLPFNGYGDQVALALHGVGSEEVLLSLT